MFNLLYKSFFQNLKLNASLCNFNSILTICIISVPLRIFSFRRNEGINISRNINLFSLQYKHQMAVFPTLFNTSTREIPTLLCTSSLKKVPLSGGTSPYSPLQGVRPGESETLKSLALAGKKHVTNPLRTSTLKANLR